MKYIDSIRRAGRSLKNAKARTLLTSGSYYSKSKPSSSFLYQKMLGNKGAVMPISGSNSEYNALILAWIKQGANNN